MNEPATELINNLAVEAHISASPAAVWKALTADIGLWWPAEFYTGGEAGSRSFRLEAHPGGRMYEEWEDGGGLLWAQVCTVRPLELLQATGLSFPEWGGPAVNFVSWKLTATDDGCTLRFEEHAFGRSTDDYHSEKTKGWNFLNSTLKAHLEGTSAPKWE